MFYFCWLDEIYDKLNQSQKDWQQQDTNTVTFKDELINNLENIYKIVYEFCKSQRELKIAKIAYPYLINEGDTSFSNVYSKIAKLSFEEQNQLAKLIEENSLSEIINSIQLITDRLTVLHELKLILFDANISLKIFEITLNKLVADNLWLFGDDYTFGVEEMRLSSIIKKYTDSLGNKTINNHRVDLFLSKQYFNDNDEYFENLIVELKRPNIIVKTEDLFQLLKYATDIITEITNDKIQWTFILLGTKIDNKLYNFNGQNSFEFSHMINKTNVKIYIKSWLEIIQNAEKRYQFIISRTKINLPNEVEMIKLIKDKYLIT